MSEVEEAWQEGRVHTTHVKAVEGGTAIEYEAPSAGSRDPPKETNGAWPKTYDVYFLDVERYAPEDKARLEKIRQIIIKRFAIDAEHVSLRDASIVRWAASLVARRAARMSACSIAAVLIQTGHAKLGGGFTPKEKHIVVGVDGSLIEHYPRFNTRLRASLRTLVGVEVEDLVDIGMAKDGSGVGGASL